MQISQFVKQSFFTLILYSPTLAVQTQEPNSLSTLQASARLVLFDVYITYVNEIGQAKVVNN